MTTNAVLILLQIIAIVIHGCILLKYREYCGHCDWWWDVGAWFHFIMTFIPIFGIIVCMVGPMDYIKNVAEAAADRGDAK